MGYGLGFFVLQVALSDRFVVRIVLFDNDISFSIIDSSWLPC
jgi:hypothetical protein